MRYAAVGTELSGTILVPIGLGLWLDYKFGWSPVGVICGMVLGLLLAGLSLYKLVLRTQQDQQAD